MTDSRPSLRQIVFEPIVLVIMVVCTGIELVLVAADAGLIGTRLWRIWSVQNGAFWTGLLRNWRPNFTGQPATMFFSYAFLHAGFWHLAGNMVALVVLARLVFERTGRWGFLLIYVVSVFAGALTFALVAPTPTPMVGASGALFGLAGAWQVWEVQAHRQKKQGFGSTWLALGLLVVLNVALWWMNDGELAWQAHLGGFLAGAAVAKALSWRA